MVDNMELDIDEENSENSELNSDLESDDESRKSLVFGLCPDCNEPNKDYKWCQQCNSNRFQQDFHKWTSGNKSVDEFIQKSQLNTQYSSYVLEWIPYNRLTKIKYLDKGGFSTVYKTTWLDGPIEEWNYEKQQWNRWTYEIDIKDEDDNISKIEGWEVVIKSLDNSSNLNDEFLNEWKRHYNCYTKTVCFIRLYGITQDPNTLDYMIVMEYAYDGSLRKYLPSIIKFNWYTKLNLLYNIIVGLVGLHKSQLVHRDLHDGNILINKQDSCISDLGLCKPLSYYSSTNNNKNNVYGVLPYIAPEVLRGNPYTPASDIYSFSMIMWEFISGVPPFDDRAHDLQLSLDICKGERPEIPEIATNIPECYINLMTKCWDSDPHKRPTASEVEDIINSWCENAIYYYKDGYNTKPNIEHEIINENTDEIIKEKEEIFLDESLELEDDIKEFWKADKALAQVPIKQSHPQAYRTSRLLDFTRKLNEILDQDEKEIFDYKDNNQSSELHETGISQSIDILSLTELREDNNHKY